MKSVASIIALTAMAWSLSAIAGSHAEPVPLSELSHAHGIGFDATEPGAIFVATHNGLFRAGPGGMASAVSEDRNDYMGFTPDPALAGRLLASGHSEGGNLGVIVSEDGGASWTQLASGEGGPVDFHAMSVSRADPRRIYGLYGGIQVSRDGGVSWTVAGPGPERVIDLAASPADPDQLYAGTIAGLMLSADAGKTWRLVGPPGVAATMVETTPEGSTYAFFAGSGLFRLSPTDGKWSALAGDFGEDYFLHLAADPADPAHLVAVTGAGPIIESADGGMSWQPFGS